MMRDPAWLKGSRACTMLMHPADAENLELNDDQTVRVTTEAGSIDIELEVTARSARLRRAFKEVPW